MLTSGISILLRWRNKTSAAPGEDNDVTATGQFVNLESTEI